MANMPRPYIVIGKPFQRANERWYFRLFGNKIALHTDKREEAFQKWMEEYWLPYKAGKLHDPHDKKMLKDVIRAFLDQKSVLKAKRTYTGYKCRLNQFLAVIGNKPYTDITADDLIHFKMYLVSKNQKPKSINAMIRHINCLLNSLDWKDIKPPHKGNPEWKSSKYIKKHIDMLKPEEADILLDWSKHIPEFKYILPLEIYCGIPCNEFMFPIYFGTDKIILNRMKTNTEMGIPIPSKLKPFIDPLLDKGFVNLWHTGIRDFNKKHKFIREGIGIERLTPHYFKHVFVSILNEQGVPLIDISNFTGTTIETLEKVYIHSTGKKVQEEIDNYAERVTA